MVIAVILICIVAAGQQGNSTSNSGSADTSSQTTSATNSSSSSSKSSSNNSTSPSSSSSTASKPTVNKSSLQAAVDKAAAIPNDNYTADSWNGFQVALSTAQQLLADDTATQTTIDNATTSLTNAQNALVKNFDPKDYEAPTFKEVARNPDNWKGKKVTFTGRVLQVVEGTSETDLRVATDGEYDDVIMVGFKPSILNGTHVLEDDNVTIYGECIGQYTYTSTLGASISLPGVYADKVVIN